MSDLPPLPEPMWPERGRERAYTDAFSADQMLAYGRAVEAATLERAMTACMAAYASAPPHEGFFTEEVAAYQAELCAAAIRALKP